MPREKVSKGNARNAYFETTFTETGKTVRSYGQERLRSELKKDPEKLVERFANDYYFFKSGIKRAHLDDFRARAMDGAEPPTSAERTRRSTQRREISRKIYEYNVRHAIIQQMCPGNLDRYFDFLYPYADISEKGLADTAQFMAVLDKQSTASPEEKREAITRQLERIGRIDLTKLDPRDPQTILDNFDDAITVMTFGWEGQQIHNIKKDLGSGFLTDPRVRPFLEKLDLMYELAAAMRVVMEMTTSPLYDEFGLEPLDRCDLFRAIDDEGNTVQDVFFNENPMVDSRIDGSATNYMLRVQGGLMTQSTLLKKDMTMEQRITAFNGDPTQHTIHAERYLNIPRDAEREDGIASDTDYSRETGHIPSSDTAAALHLEKYLYDRGSATYSAPEFHPAVKSDAARLYVKGDDGLFRLAFPEAADPAWAGLTEQQIDDILTSDNKYAYFPAGETEPKTFENGTLRTPAEVRSKTDRNVILREKVDVKFAPECRRPELMLNRTEEKIIENEGRVHTLDSGFFDLQRVREMLTKVYGTAFDDRGTDALRTFSQQIVDSALNNANGAQLRYPASDGRLTEENVSALSILSMARPDVNGSGTLIEQPEAYAANGINMLVTDLYIQRANSPQLYSAFVVNGRAALAPALGEYMRSGSPESLAETVAKGLHVLAVSTGNRSSLNINGISEMIPAQMVKQLFDDHPDILKAAADYAVKNGFAEQFINDVERCRQTAALYEQAEKSMQAERRLLAYENGELKSDEGKPLSIIPEERKQLETEAAKLAVFNAEAVDYAPARYDKLPEDVTSKDDEIINRLISEGRAAEMGKYTEQTSEYMGFVQNEMPTAPTQQLAFLHEGGMKALEAIISDAPDRKDAADILGRLSAGGLIPAVSTDAGFDYDKAIEKFTQQRAKESTHEFREQYSKIAADFGMEFDDMRELALNSGLSIEEYANRMMGENAAAESKAEAPAAKNKGMSSFEKKLSDEKIMKLSGKELCAALISLNELSAKSTGDIYAEYQTGELIGKVCIRMHDYERTHPDFARDKARYLKKEDFFKAGNNVQRGISAAKKLGADFINRAPEEFNREVQNFRTSAAEPDAPEIEAPQNRMM